MIDILTKCAFSLLAGGFAYFIFRRWQKNKSLWHGIAIAASILAALAFWLSRVHGLLLLVPALLLFALGEAFKRK